MNTITLAGVDRTSTEIWDVSEHNHGHDIDFDSLAAIRNAPAWLTSGERLLLFTLVYCLRPRRYLEIGVLHGGSSLIVAKAIDAVKGDGKLVLVDPKPQIADSNWIEIKHRSVLLRGGSPEILEEAEHEAGGPFDFVFIDANHETRAVMRDANGVLPHLTDGAYILFHDNFRAAVSMAIDRFVSVHSASIVDFGALTREFTRERDRNDSDRMEGSQVKRSCGLRLVQYRRRHGRRIPVNAVRGVWFRFDFLFERLFRGIRRLATGPLRRGELVRH
jgi:predicted O-methyltransferase YrrM